MSIFDLKNSPIVEVCPNKVILSENPDSEALPFQIPFTTKDKNKTIYWCHYLVANTHNVVTETFWYFSRDICKLNKINVFILQYDSLL